MWMARENGLNRCGEVNKDFTERRLNNLISYLLFAISK
jgi:hypothetical protein